MRRQVPDFSIGNIIVFGDVMLDRYWYGDTNRISPEAPVPVVHINDNQALPGGAGNVALNLVNLGCHATLFGMAGLDEAGDQLAVLLKNSSIDAHLIHAKGSQTTTKLRLLSSNQQLVRMDFETPQCSQLQTELQDAGIKALPEAEVLILSDYNKGCLIDPQPLIAAAVQHGVTVIVDPKTQDFMRYRGASIITPNLKEFTAAVGPCIDADEMIAKGQKLIEQCELDALLITRGADGMTLIEKSGHHFTLPARAPEVYDVTGAGDTVVAVLAGSLAAGCKMEDAVGFANVAAGIVVGLLGAASVSPQMLLDAIQQQKGTTAVIVGTFDIIRSAHIQAISQLYNLYDSVVAVVCDTDDQKNIPIHSMDARVATISSFRAVDRAIKADGGEIEGISQILGDNERFFMPDCEDLAGLGAKPLILMQQHVSCVQDPLSIVC